MVRIVSASAYSTASNNNSSNINQNANNDLPSRLKDLDIEKIELTHADFIKTKKAFKVGKPIGQGTFGQVYNGNYQGQQAVAKFCKYSGEEQKKYILNEIKSLNLFNHPNVVKIHAFSHETDQHASGDGEFVLILEHGGDTLARMTENNLISPRQIISIFEQVLSGLEYIHKFGDQKLIHRDIKPENIFVRANGDTFDVKIGDLGQIRNTATDNSVTMRGAQGTRPYMAFEVFKQYVDCLITNNEFDPKIYDQLGDVMAVGLSILFTITGIVPFNKSITQTSNKIPCLPDYFPEEFIKLVMNMIHPEVTQRLTAKKARCYLAIFEDEEKNMSDFDVACRQFRDDEGNKDYEYKNIDEVLSKNSQIEFETLAAANYEYKGQVKNGKAHGYGVKTFKSNNKTGKIESGFFRNGFLDGFGIAIYPSGGSYHGEWKEYQYHGQGTKIWNKGPGKVDVYKGRFERDQRNGHGTYTSDNGDIYVGNWVNDKKHGHGKLTYNASGKTEEGEWKDSKFVG